MEREDCVRNTLKAHGLKGTDKQVDNFISNVSELAKMIRKRKEKKEYKSPISYFFGR